MGNRRFKRRAGIRRTWAAMAFAFALLGGCATTPWNLQSSVRPTAPPSDTRATSPSPLKSASSQADAQSLEQVMSEFQQFMSLDPAAQDKLMADLKQVDPGLQPMFLKTFLAEAANKRREEQREAEKQKQTTCLELKSSVGHSSPGRKPDGE